MVAEERKELENKIEDYLGELRAVPEEEEYLDILIKLTRTVTMLYRLVEEAE